MKLKDYDIPQYASGDGLAQEDLAQYSLKNFDLKAYQLADTPPDPAPLPLAAAPQAASPDPLPPNPWSATPEPPDEPRFGHAANPLPTALSQLALGDVQFGPHFNLQQPLYIAASPSESWKMPRWVATTVGLFFGSAALFTLAFCVSLLRDPSAAPPAPSALPAAAVAAPSAAAAQPGSSATRVASAPAAKATPQGAPADRAAARHSGPATATLTRADPALRHRVVVSRHPSVVRRQIYRPRRVDSDRTSSSVAPQETETASSRPPKDALDQLLGESSL